VHPDLKPSKIEALPYAISQGYDIDVLRDDLIHPLIAGNKWRKLSGIIEWAKTLEQAHIVTFGGAYSNHLVATAVAGKLLGIQTTGFVRGDEIRDSNAYEICCQDKSKHYLNTISDLQRMLLWWTRVADTPKHLLAVLRYLTN